MIPLPASLTVKRSRAAERMLGDAARAWIESEERAPGIHASDLLDARQAIYRKIDPKTLPDRLVNIFLIGKVLHAFVLQTVDGITNVDIKTTDAGSYFSEKIGITYSPDKIVGGKVRELKTSRSYKAPDTIEDISHYLEQILVYLASTETRTAQLWVLYLNLRDESTGKLDPCFRGYDVEISEGDLAGLIEFCKSQKELIEKGVNLKDPKVAPLCREWLCNRKLCDWYDQCQPEGRWHEADQNKKTKALKKPKPA